MTAVNDTALDVEVQYPESWKWNEHGNRVAGTFVKWDQATSEYGERLICVLDVDGSERSIWLNQDALVGKFNDELEKRDLVPGERILIRRGDEMTKSKNGRDFWPFKVLFPDRPPVDPLAFMRIKRNGKADDAESTASTAGDDDLPEPSSSQGTTDDDIPF